LNGVQGVVGSNPIAPTKIIKKGGVQAAADPLFFWKFEPSKRFLMACLPNLSTKQVGSGLWRSAPPFGNQMQPLWEWLPGLYRRDGYPDPPDPEYGLAYLLACAD
jgi:hypothetical protein